MPLRIHLIRGSGYRYYYFDQFVLINIIRNLKRRITNIKITTFNPLIVTKDAESAIALFESLGFERHHTKGNIGIEDVTDVRMKDPNGFYVDISQGHGEYTMIRMNVDYNRIPE